LLKGVIGKFWQSTNLFNFVLFIAITQFLTIQCCDFQNKLLTQTFNCL